MNFIAVFIGGGAGAITRYILTLMFSKTLYGFPVATLTANFFGCFIASALFTLFLIKSDIDSIYKLLLITGFCGGLSTLSALSLEVMEYMQSGLYLKACGYIFTSLFICTISVILGIVLVRKYV